MNIGFQRHTDLALSALAVLSSRNASISGPDLADEVGTTITFLPQVMAPLIRARWVTSHRGPGGGYRLTPQAVGLSVRDVVDATEGPMVTGLCVLRDAPCPGNEQCPIHVAWVEARAVLVSGFESVRAVQN